MPVLRAAPSVSHRFHLVAQSKSKHGPSSPRRRGSSHMPGAIILIVILLSFPIIVGLSTAALAGIIGHFLYRDAEIRHEGSELLDTNV